MTSALATPASTLPPALRQRLADPDPAARRVAVIALADEEDEDGLPWLIAALTDTDAGVRAEAAARLAGWETDAAVRGLLGALRDPTPAVRAAAAQSLSELKLSLIHISEPTRRS